MTPFVDMRIVDDKGNVLPRDGKAYGDLQVRGPHVIQRYFKVRCGDDVKGCFSGTLASLHPY